MKRSLILGILKFPSIIVMIFPNAFNDAAKVTKSHIPAVNTPARIYVPEKHKEMDDDVLCQKRGRPIGSKDAVPRKKREMNQETSLL